MGNANKKIHAIHDESVNKTYTISNDKFKATIFYNTNIKHANMIRFEIWNFEIYFEIKNYMIAENISMIKNLVQYQKLIHRPIAEMISDLRSVISYITNTSNGIYEDFYTLFIGQIIVAITQEIILN